MLGKYKLKKIEKREVVENDNTIVTHLLPQENMYLHFQTLYGKSFLTDFFFILEAKTYQQIKR